MAPNGTVYGIELLNANEQLKRDNGGKISSSMKPQMKALN